MIERDPQRFCELACDLERLACDPVVMPHCFNAREIPMAKDPGPSPGSVAHAKRIREEINRLKRKGRENASEPEEPSSADKQGPEPRSLRDIIHDRMDRLDKKPNG